MASASPSIFVIPFLAAGAIGCIVLVHPEAGGAHCQLRGAETDCGRCLAERCSAEIDAICIDDPAGALPAVEQCAAASDAACGKIPASDAGTCLATRCRATCFEKSGKSLTRCEESFLAPDLACSCRAAGATNDVRCEKSLYPHARCCAPPGWPSPGFQCTCNSAACVPGTGGCICTLSDNVEPDTASECKSTYCCATRDLCQCRDRECSGGEQEVARCNLDALACPIGTAEVASCSIRQ